MWNPFKAPLPDGLRSGALPAEYGFPVSDLPYPVTKVEMDDSPNNLVDANEETHSPSTWRSNTGELFPASHPSYDRPYHRTIDATPGPAANTAPSVAPAVGSTDLAFPRDQGGIPGTNRMLGGTGPVTGENSEWTGKRAELFTPQIGNAGPVAGGPDYSSQLAAAYFQQEAALFSRSYSESAMVSAV